MNVIHEKLKNTQYDIDDQDLADAVEEIFRHSHHDNVKDLDLEDALEADVHESLHSVHEERSEPVDDEEPQSEDEVLSDNGEPETEDVTVDVEEPIVETRVEESAMELEEPVEELEPEEVEPVEEQHTEAVTEPEEDEVDSGPESLGIHDAEEVLETEEVPEQETLEVTETGEADVEETIFEDEPDIAASENTASEYKEPEAPVIDDSEEEDLNLNENVPESEEPVNEDENKDFLDDENTQGAVEDEYTPDDAEEEPQADELADTPEPEEEIEEPTPETPDTEAIEETELSDLEETLYDSAPEEEEVPVAQEDLERDEALSEEELYRTEEILHAAEEQQEDERLQEEQIAEESNEATETQAEDVRTDDVREDNTLASEKQVEEPAVKDTVSDEKKEKAKKKKPKLLNKFDKSIKAELDAAEKLRKKGKVDDALKAFEGLVNKYPESPKARYGKAQSEDDLAEKMRSNEVLLRAINTYGEVAELPSVPSDLAKLSLKRRANRQQFLGRMRGAVVTLQKLVQLYPDDISLRNDLGVGYLLLGDNNSAKQVYEEVLSMAPNNGFAKVHYGFILKAENKVAESIPYLKEGLESGEPGTDDGRFYFHLGDAMQRVGDKEAYQWYETGHKRGHFASVWQRSLYNVNGLKAQPWWTAKETGYTDLVRTLEANWKLIRDEGLAVMDKVKGLFVPEDENLREKGDWSQYTLWQQGRKNEKSCNNAPRTCSLLERFPESTGCRRGQIKYSVMHPGTHVWPHTGPTNCRLRMHLGLVIPKQGCKIRCANDTRSWEEGKVLVFDDSFEHEVWQDADSYRLILIVDVWHPELTPHQRRTLPAI